MKNILTTLLLCLLTTVIFAQKTFPQDEVYDERDGHYAFTNATIFTDYDSKISNGTLIIKKGKVVNVGTRISIPADAVEIDMTGKYIYPSFIDLFTSYGMPEAKKAEGGRGRRPQEFSKKEGAYSWNQALKTEFRAHEAFSYDEKAAEEFRKLGFGVVQSLREDGISRGSSTLVSLGDKREHLTILKEVVAHQLSVSKGTSTQGYPSSQMGMIALMRQTYLDADWYKKQGYKEEKNIQLQRWNDLSSLPQIMAVRDRLEILRMAKMGKEFGINYIMRATGDEYQRINEIKATGSPLIVSLNFPKAYDVEDPYDARLVSLADMKHWELAPSNPSRLADAGIEFALTTSLLKDKKAFWKNLRKAVKHGLSEADALKALTYTPAKLLGMNSKIGSLESGKLANFIITSGNIFDKGTSIYHNWVQGQPFVLEEPTSVDLRGNYELKIGKKSYVIKVKGTKDKAKIVYEESDSNKIDISHTLTGNKLNLVFKPEEDGGFYTLTGTATDKNWKGGGTNAEGNWVSWEAIQSSPFEKEEKPASSEADMKDKDEDKKEKTTSEIMYPFIAYGNTTLPTQGTFLIKNATVWTNESDGILENTDVLVSNGKISNIGKNLSQSNCTVIDGTGKHLTCGIIDEHSHIAISRGVNEGTQNSSAEVSIGDVVNSEDVNIYRQLAGGVTMSQLLHGSANPIGGQSAIIKLRFGYAPEDMKFENAPKFIKFALGENVKQSNWGDNNNVRFPQTRMGVEQVYEGYFTRAREYEQGRKSGKITRRDLDLEALLEIINKQRFITCHSYVQSEINMLMKTAERFGFNINTFTHVLEGYKIADKLHDHGAGGSTFSDWWAYKYEVIDAIPYNGAIMHEQDVVVAYNSDDAEMGRRLNQEAAKAVMYGGLSEEDAWKFVTLNPAKLLRIDSQVGSIKTGKDADLVLWSDNPLSIYARAEMTLVDGIKFYDKQSDQEKREAIRTERARLIQKLIAEKKGGADTQKPKKKDHKHYHCDDVEDEGY